MNPIQPAEQASWVDPPAALRLQLETVHLWRVGLDRPSSDRERLWFYLSEDERQRAGRFYFQRDQDKFIVSRGALREILSRYLGGLPLELRFEYGEQGKPALSGDRAARSVRFNLSHSADLAMVGVTLDREIGVDLEQIVERRAEERIARRFFSQRELRDFVSLPEEERKEGFFRCWTRKEAYIKARGEGLTLPLDQFDVSLRSGEPVALLESRVDPAEAEKLTLIHVDLGDRYIGAVAVIGRVNEVTYWDWAI